MTAATPHPVPNPVLRALTEAAVDLTGATAGWLLAISGDRLRVVAVAGKEPLATVGAEIPAETGAAGFVAASGRPLALSGSTDDARLSEGVPALAGRRPTCIVSVPCVDDDALSGVLELVDKPGGAFNFDDVETATVLARVAATALASSGVGTVTIPAPAELALDLRRAAETDPVRYAVVAGVVSALLSR